MPSIAPLGEELLPPGIRARFVTQANGLDMHVLEAGDPGRPCLLLLHGFPELAYSWRKVMGPLAAAGYHVIAPDQRGYGRTATGPASYGDDPRSSSILNLVRDALGLVSALGIDHVAAVIGHDFGSPVAAYCALIRPDVFRAAALMSAPFGGPPVPGRIGPGAEFHEDLAALDPPRVHYQWYYSTPPADADMCDCPQGIHAFLRAYYHFKSADWAGNQPCPLTGWTAGELAKLPTYYVMQTGTDMAATVASEMPSPDQIANCAWLPDSELAVYATEYTRTRLQGGLQWYRCATDPKIAGELTLFTGQSIDVPSCFIAGKSDWGVHQSPGAFENMQAAACSDMRAVHLIEGAGHWVQQEQPEAVVATLVEFLSGL